MIEIKMKMHEEDLIQGKIIVTGSQKEIFHELVAIFRGLHDQLPDELFTDALDAMVKTRFIDLFDKGD